MKFWPKHRLLVILLVSTFFKDLVWTALTPIWQSPDEQAHFAQLQYYVERRTLNIDPTLNLSAEVLHAEDLLGTKRDNRGNNSYTYHPEFNVAYTNSTIGLHEIEINTLPQTDRWEMVGQEAAGYPPLFYLFSSPLYLLFSNQGLIDRVFASRFASIFCHLGLVFTAFLTGRQLWKKDTEAIVLATLVAFQPMVNFVSSGYHPDGLFNLIYSGILLSCLVILRKGLTVKSFLALIFLVYLGWETKQFMVFGLPLVGALLSYVILRRGKVAIGTALLVLIMPFFALYFQWRIPYMPSVTSQSPLASMGFLEYLKFRLPKFAFEIWPWYWGVYKWLGVTLPLWLLRVLTRVFAVVGIGLGLWIMTLIRKKKIDAENQGILFLLLSSVTYVVYLFFWDWRLMQSIGYSLGLQGRYLFPNIVSHLALVLVGITYLTFNRKNILSKILQFTMSVFFICLNLLSLAVLTRSYYDTSSLTVFITQASQYKPGAFKGDNLTTLLLFFGGMLIFYVILLGRRVLKNHAN